jgi:hypothetical protein
MFLSLILFLFVYYLRANRDSVVGKATCYVLDGPGIESQWGASLSGLFQTGTVAHPPSCKMGTGSHSQW